MTTALFIAASTAALSACAVDGTAKRGPIDLDPGTYRTAATSEGTGTASWMAGAALGAYVPYPSQIDDRLTGVMMGTTPIGSLKDLAQYVQGVETVDENKKLEFGFLTESFQRGETLTRSLMLGVLRFPDEGAARAAVKPTAEANLAARIAQDKRLDVDDTDRRVVSPSGFPAGSRAVEGRGEEGTVSTMLLVPHGNDVLLMDSYGRSAGDTTAILKRAVDRLVDGLADSGDVSMKTSMKNAEMLELTVPVGASSTDPLMKFAGTVTVPASYAHVYDDPVSAVKMFTEAGVDVVARRETTLFRATSAAKAQALKKDFAESSTPSARSLASPRDLPSATCVKAAGALTRYECTVVFDRYYATSASSKSLLDAQQKISAQYLILQQRG